MGQKRIGRYEFRWFGDSPFDRLGSAEPSYIMVVDFKSEDEAELDHIGLDDLDDLIYGLKQMRRLRRKVREE